MFLYKSQPKSTDVTNFYQMSRKIEIMSSVLDASPRYNGKELNINDIISLLSDAAIIDAMLVRGGYQNILVVTSFDETYTRLRDTEYCPIKSAGDHMLPLIHKINNSAGRMVVTQTTEDNYFNNLYDHFDCKTTKVDANYKLDDVQFRIQKDDMLFDAVVLLGCESRNKGKYQVRNVKDKFAKYCTEDFTLIDVYRSEDRILKGGSKNVSRIVANVIDTAVNSHKKIYDVTGKSIKIDRQIQRKNRVKLMYTRLERNITNLETYYRVF